MRNPSKVTSVVTENQGLLPILVEFENGKINPNHAEHLQCELYQDKNVTGKKIVAIKNDNTLYLGSPDGTTKSFRTFLAIRNLETNKVQLVQVESIRAAAALDRSLSSDSNKPDRDSAAALLDLSRVFGSKSQKRVQEQKRRFTVVAESASHLEDVAKDMTISTEDREVPEDTSLENLLPPCNRDALYPSAVYDLHDILSSEEIDILKDAYDEVVNQEKFMKKSSSFFQSLLPVCKKNPEHRALLLYAEYLIKLCNKRRVKNFKEVCNCSEVIAKRMVSEFTVSKGNLREVAVSELDKAILRIFIIGLHLSDFKMQIQPLANSLNTNITRLKLLIRITGAVLDKKDSNVAYLRVPLPKVNISARSFGKKRKL